MPMVSKAVMILRGSVMKISASWVQLQIFLVTKVSNLLFFFILAAKYTEDLTISEEKYNKDYNVQVPSLVTATL